MRFSFDDLIAATHPILCWNEPCQRLELDWIADTGKKYPIHVSAWAEGIRWSHALDQHQGIELPGLDIHLGGMLLADSPAEPVRAWQCLIPDPVLASLQKARHLRWQLLQWCSHYPQAVDLLSNNPVLLTLIAEQWQFQAMPSADIDELLNLRQTVILERIGLSGSHSAIKLLRKLHPQHPDITDIAAIQARFSDAEYLASLRHFSVINLPFLQLVQNHSWLTRSRVAAVFNEALQPDELDDRIRYFHDTIRLCHFCGLDAPALLSPCRNWEALLCLHDELTEEYNAILAGQRNIAPLAKPAIQRSTCTPFPLPPHPGTSLIKPLTSVDAILAEGLTMHHCVATYMGDVIKGTYYVYHMREPQRVTIGVHVKNGTITGLDQARHAFNRKPSKKLMAIIKQWLAESVDKESDSTP